MDLLGRALQVLIFVFAIVLGLIPAAVAGVFAKALIGPIAFWPAFIIGMVIFLNEFEPLRFLSSDRNEDEEARY